MRAFNFLTWVTFVAVVSVRGTDTDEVAYSDESESVSDKDYYNLYSEYEYDEQNTTGWFVPDENGSFYWVSKDEWAKEEWDSIEEIEPQLSKRPTFFLYTTSNQGNPTQLDYHDVDTIKKSKFNEFNPTRILIHGYMDNRLSDFPESIRREFFRKHNYNVITVDWSSVSRRSYKTARSLVGSIGKRVGKFIDCLKKEVRMKFEDLTIIGYDLGAHVAGFAGKRAKRGKVEAIIGLDPLSALFEYHKKSERLANTDANYVETIQTTVYSGFDKPIGKATFYPNGGKQQPGCNLDQHCSHSKSYIYYAEAIRCNNFISIKCKTRESCYSRGSNPITNVQMGSQSNNGSISGMYYVPIVCGSGNV